MGAYPDGISDFDTLSVPDYQLILVNIRYDSRWYQLIFIGIRSSTHRCQLILVSTSQYLVGIELVDSLLTPVLRGGCRPLDVRYYGCCFGPPPPTSTSIGTIIVIDNLVYRDHPSLKIRGVPKDVRSYDVERVRNKEHLSTRVGCGRVHPTIENILDKCGVVAPNLPMKTDDLSHSIGPWLDYSRKGC
uniref:Uncharacterized protein n=2 Tax=Oryza sativa subsp. japonica TaxID=39947 RepID=Q53KP1_ORYSJ|nr:hypothetical protein LOC_Os11g15540 [Oryza sativa Japonica Group]ABA92458.1 hypothetical protein LOC_Os11g15540 [Oryza sativa Japonica Group]